MRRKNRRPLAIIDDPNNTRSDLASSDPALDDQVVDRLAIDRAFPLIPEEFRAPVVLRDVIGMDYAEIAETLQLAPGTVRSRIARGRRHLAKQLEISDFGNQNRTDERHKDRNE